MHGLLADTIATAAAGVLGALLLALGNGVLRLARSVRESASATGDLVGQVAKLQEDYQGTREQVAVLWDREHWPIPSGQYPPQPQWNGKR